VSVAADERNATVRVRDEGIGLDEAELAQLFRRGYRAEAAQRIKGDGLGLYLAHGLVAKHGGRMWAESLGHGQGSTFGFELPLRAEQSVEASAEHQT
jgi:signal transduction histidine kinase